MKLLDFVIDLGRKNVPSYMSNKWFHTRFIFIIFYLSIIRCIAFTLHEHEVFGFLKEFVVRNLIFGTFKKDLKY